MLVLHALSSTPGFMHLKCHPHPLPVGPGPTLTVDVARPLLGSEEGWPWLLELS